MEAELGITARWVAPVNPAVTLENHAVLVSAGKVQAILPSDEARHTCHCKEWIDRPDHLLIPGLINAHTHAAMTLLRGYADDMELASWLREHIWPAEAKHVSADFVHDGTTLAVAEMLCGGTTTFADMYFFPGSAIEASCRLGMRIVAGIVVIDFPSSYAQTAPEYIDRGLAVRDKWSGHPLVKFMFAPHAPYSVGESTLNRISSYAAETGLPVQIHLHETAEEIDTSIEKYGMRPLDRLHHLGMLGPNLSAVHMTQVSETDIELLAGQSVSVVHCPQSNLKLASGFCPISLLQKAGINVGLGTDGAASNNDLDLINELQTAALLAKAVAHDPAAMTAEQALFAATQGGAKALGLDSELGTIEPRKWADIVAIDFGRLGMRPVYNPVSQLVYTATRDCVSDVWVAGKRRVSQGKLCGLNTQTLNESLSTWERRLKESQ